MIELHHVKKVYRREGRTKTVLNDVSGTLDTRKTYALLGANGAGKSTFLRLLAGSELPDRGRILRRGRISWPLGFSGGFHPQMSGRQNVAFIAQVYNENVVDAIAFVEDFAEIGMYMNMPVGTYSSGMMARLAFAVSMAVEFDFYLIDEITAVGDERFAARCRDAFAERRARSGLILASHAIGTIRDYCEHALVLREGNLTYFEDLDEGVAFYRSAGLA
jgi:capsular polysaccharide transport system ATP-binding protein